MPSFVHRLPLAAIALCVVATVSQAQRSNRLTAAEHAAGWRRLFDGTSLHGWHGALYDMFPPSHPHAVKPAGEWNSSRLVFVGNHGEHWLNGGKVVSFDLGTPAADSAFAKSKYSKYPAWFPLRRKGQIVLQDHDAGVWCRNIKIREIQ